ncbi:MAG: molybdopterin molybdotransferase MoeA [Roseovarius sp.]
MEGANISFLSVDAARARVLSVIEPVPQSEPLPLEAAQGRILAEPAPARTDLPPFDNSAMDGYAVRSADLDGAGPFRLEVGARIIAGDTRRLSLAPGMAARIFTGAPIPEGADAVVIQENVTRAGRTVEIARAPRPGQHIRRRGEDHRRGDPVLSAGQLLTAGRLALLAATGVDRVRVRRQLRVGLFSTGNELLEPGSALGHGQIYNSNRIMLRAMMAQGWIALSDFGILPDDPGAIREAIRQAAGSQDAIVSSGGVSVGEEDHVLDALKREDATLDVLKVAIRPGKPLTVGRVGRALFVGLPGNPYAAAVTFLQIARPALRRAAGLVEEDDSWIPAVSGFDYRRQPGRREYIPVTWSARDALGRPIVQRLGQGGSASLGPLAMARGIAMIEAEREQLSQGQPLRVEPLPGG